MPYKSFTSYLLYNFLGYYNLSPEYKSLNESYNILK
jgi:hypothetical protein